MGVVYMHTCTHVSFIWYNLASFITCASRVPLSWFKSWYACTWGCWLAHPLAVLPAEELRRPRTGTLLSCVLHTHTLCLLHKSTRYSLRERGKSTDQGRTLLEEDPDRQQSHAGTLSLKGQVKASLIKRAESQGLHVQFLLPVLP